MASAWPQTLALEHPHRAAIYKAVRAEPGVGLRDLARGCLTPVGTTRHHLTILVRSGLLREERAGRRIAFLPRGERRRPELLATLRDPDLGALRQAIARKGRLSQLQLRTHFAGMPRSTIQHRLRRLVEAGALRSFRQGRGIFYEVV